MIWKGRLAPSRLVGLSLLVIGLALLVYSPALASEAVTLQVFYLWTMIFCIGIGSIMAIGLPLRRSAKASVVVVLGLAWSLLFFLPLPSEFRLWPAVIVAAVALLVYRHYYNKRVSSVKSPEAGGSASKALRVSIANAGLALPLAVVSLFAQLDRFFATRSVTASLFCNILGRRPSLYRYHRGPGSL
jgi:hypothetical protein